MCQNTRLMISSFHACMKKWGEDLTKKPPPAELGPCGCRPNSIMCPYAHLDTGTLKGVAEGRLNTSLSAHVEHLLCKKTLENGNQTPLHSPACINGSGRQCGLSARILPDCPHLVRPDLRASQSPLTIPDATWKAWGKVVSPSGAVRVAPAPTPLTQRKDLLAAYRKQLADYIPHNFLATWQSREIKNSRFNLLLGQIWIQEDFSENVTLTRGQDTAMAFFNNEGMTVLPMVIRYLVRRVGVGGAADVDVMREEHVFLADRGEHSWRFIHLSLIKVIDNLRKRGILVSELLMSSDNCAAQNKCGAMFMGINALAASQKVGVRWNHTGPAHGKGEADGVGGGVKTCLNNALKVRTGGLLFFWGGGEGGRVMGRPSFAPRSATSPLDRARPDPLSSPTVMPYLKVADGKWSGTSAPDAVQFLKETYSTRAWRPASYRGAAANDDLKVTTSNA